MDHVWNPAEYLKFAGQRLRPALDLLARVDAGAPETVYDLGCGPGNVTGILAERWPGAAVTGVDQSPEMLARARREHPALAFQEADLAAWEPAAPAGVLVSNAALQWISGHETLLPRLMGLVRPGGVLAVQMPHNHDYPSHTCMRDAIDAGPWARRLRPVPRLRPVADPDAYYGWLAPVAESVDIWQTVYLQVMEGDNPIADWTGATALKPLLAALDDADERDEFFRVYSKLVQAAYPKGDDGKTLFPFRRLFIVARR